MRIHRFNQEEFSSLRDEWQNLLARTKADPLFLSWDWMNAWWQTFRQNHYELLLLGVYEGSNLMCIAPLYIYDKASKFGFKKRRVTSIGSNTEFSSGFRSEYMEFLADPSQDTALVNSIFSWLTREIAFDDLYLPDLVIGSTTHRCTQKLTEQKLYVRLQLASQTYGIKTEGSFDDYIKNLGKNSRLQVFNRRKVLEASGNLIIEPVDSTNFTEILDSLGEFHLQRWQEQLEYDVHKKFVIHLCQNNEINVSGIKASRDNILLGCTFDIDCGEKCYNFQLGFADNVDKKVSMGSLALGYGMERCFTESRLKYYDLMAGQGKNSNYKTRFAEPGAQFESLEIIANPWLKILYQIKDKLDSIKGGKPPEEKT